MKNEMIAFRIDDKTKTDLEKEAKREGRTLSGHVLFILKKHLENKKNKGGEK